MSSWLTGRQKGEEEVIYVEVDHNNGKQAILMEEDYLEFDDSAESAIEDLVDPSDGSNSEEEDAPESKTTIPSAYEDIISPQQRFTTREGCQSLVRLPRSIAVAGQTFGSASTSRSMVTRSRSHAIDHLQALDDITTLAPLASLQSRILVEFSRVSPLTYMRLSKAHFKEIIPTVYHTFHVTADFEKCLFGAHPMTETKCLGFLHVKHLFLGTDTGLCLHPFPEPFWNAKDFLLAIINLGKPERYRYIFPNLKGLHVVQELLVELRNEDEMGLHPLFWQALTEYLTPPSCPINLHLVRDYNTHEIPHNIPDTALHHHATRNIAFHMYNE